MANLGIEDLLFQLSLGQPGVTMGCSVAGLTIQNCRGLEAQEGLME